MKKIKDIVLNWHNSANKSRDVKQISIPVNLHDVARIHALTDLYPHLSEQMIITDLLSAALDEVEACLPYVEGQKIIATDDHGDPVYEDAGLTPKLLELTKNIWLSLNSSINHDMSKEIELFYGLFFYGFGQGWVKIEKYLVLSNS